MYICSLKTFRFLFRYHTPPGQGQDYQIAGDAEMAQIEDRQYAAPFAGDPRKFYKIGVNFSSATRRIEGWRDVER